MPKKAKSVHVFWPSNGSQGAACNWIEQSKSVTAAVASVAVHPASPNALPQSSTSNNDSSSPAPPPPSSPIPPPHLISWQPAANINILLTSLPTLLPNTFVNDFMSMSGSSSSQANSEWQEVTGPTALLSTSEELKDFNSTIKDLMKLKEVNKRIEWWEWASSSEHQTREMAALQKQDAGWMRFNHPITMMDHFKLDISSADAYMTLKLPTLHRLWLKEQLTGIKYVVNELNDDREPIVVWSPWWTYIYTFAQLLACMLPAIDCLLTCVSLYFKV